jgi:hypothetical protein
MKTFASRVVIQTIAIAGLLFAGSSCGGGEDVVGPCEAAKSCGQVCLDLDLDPMTPCELQFMCQPTFDPNSGCQTVEHWDGGSSCGACNPNANIVSASLQTAGQCATVVHHSSTYETPGCWFDMCAPWPFDDECWHDCFFWCGSCYTTDEWDEIVYVPEPFFGGCP